MDMHFEEVCPCGASIKVSGGYESQLKSQILTWHRAHDKHANLIAKQVAERTKFPLYYVPNPIPGANPQPWWWNPNITFGVNTDSLEKKS